MSGKRRSENLAPALFPFLAVLVCTMGALVVILVIIVSQASTNAKRAVEAEHENIKVATDEVQFVSDEMIAQRATQQEQIEMRRNELTAIEDHISRLVQELNDLQSTAKAIDSRQTETEQSRKERDEKLRSLEQTLEKEKNKLDEAKDKASKEPPAFAILPYKGTNGTTRRPIYLECTDRGVVIQPEGIVVSIDDLKPPHGPGNPLDASLRVIRNAFSKLDEENGSSVSPYPLLVVRPSGIKSYALARAAMSGWDDQFGYELIDEKMPLAFPPSIPGLGPVIEENLTISRQRQLALIASMPSRYGNGTNWEGDFNEETQEFSPSQSSERSPASRARAGGGTDWSSIDSDVLSNGQIAASALPRAKRSQGNVGGVNQSGTNGNEPPNNLVTDGSQWKMIEESSQTEWGTNGSNPPVGYSSSTKTGESPNRFSQGASQGLQTNQGLSQGSMGNANSLVSTGMNAQQTSSSNGPSFGNDPNQATSDNWEGSGGSGREAVGNGGNQKSTSTAGTFSNNSKQFSSKGTAAGSSSPMGNPDTSTTQVIQPGSMTERERDAISDPNAFQSSQASSSQSNPPEDQFDQNNIPQPTLSMNATPDKKPKRPKKNAASSQGRVWVSKRRDSNSTSVSRPITIVAMNDRWLVMRDDSSNSVEKVIPLNQGPSAAVELLSDAISDRVDTWGVAVAGGYWQPKLIVEVAPQAELSAQRLQKLMDGSDLELEMTPLKTAPR